MNACDQLWKEMGKKCKMPRVYDPAMATECDN